MVLSNKKLKQKLRQDLVKSLSVSVAETNPESASSLQSQSLKSLLDSASHKPRLSKREIRRKLDTSTRGDVPNEVERDAAKTDEKIVKKRKREDTVEDKTEDGANRALAFDRAAMGDRYLTIQQYVKTTPSVPRTRTPSGFVPEMVEGYHRVYIGNLAWDTTEREIRKLFSDCVINTVRLGKNKETGDFKGYAHVDFKDSVSVAMALKLDQQVICGRPVKICCALKERPVGDHSTNPTPGETNNADETDAAADDVNYFENTMSSGKIKRRSCYECGEKGHLSTACPKKLQETVNARPPTMPSYDLQRSYG
ncbi:hypothetical protein F2Q70_00040906, partial [Brassica cretica]